MRNGEGPSAPAGVRHSRMSASCFKSLDELSSNYDHIYISPHLDDAALSCGGAIARHVADNQRVLVVTVCSGIPPADRPFSPFAQQLHARWNLDADQVVQMRLREDRVALNHLGADGYWLAFLDAIYRQPDAYMSDETLFGKVAADDMLRRALFDALHSLARHCPGATFYAPLGVGWHVDHQIVYVAAARLAENGVAVAFYEDFPYVQVAGALEQRRSYLNGGGFVPKTLDIDATLAWKISAIGAYASQMEILFGGTAAMAQAVTMYAASLRPDTGTHGERLWLRTGDR